MGKGGRTLKFLFGFTVLVAVLVMVVGDLVNRATTTTKSITISSTREFKRWEFVAKEKLGSHQDFHFSYVSKRRVPNGPDPIHNSNQSFYAVLGIFSSSFPTEREHPSLDNSQVEPRCVMEMELLQHSADNHQVVIDIKHQVHVNRRWIRGD
ncbi:hypothetical protein F3Y22_tig00110388pilonHSYRG00127 [Hibiscus syriacus]|uniref:CLAVATA3/ESR (CLE)-related protein 25 n=1 Tax=Hibiscus syriacus TaxID=106335 RepID=A0A6A3AS27_HIBSY|nr:hypothetical protein F3Y22_tig00110388pilonHSYRG00127 [Hibiscus syriacus]